MKLNELLWPWGQLIQLKATLAHAEAALKVKEHEVHMLQGEMSRLRLALAKSNGELTLVKASLEVAQKNDHRDSTGRFTKGK